MGLSNLPNPCFGPDELGLYLGCYGWTWAWRGAHCTLGLTDGIFGLFIYPYHIDIHGSNYGMSFLPGVCFPHKISEPDVSGEDLANSIMIPWYLQALVLLDN